MRNLKSLKISALVLFLLILINDIKAQNLGIGTKNPRVKFHIVNGLEGTMGFPYETLVVEKSEDSKLGIYNTAANPVNYSASSIALGFTKYLDGNNNYSSYEMQYGVWDDVGFMLRFNAISRNVLGFYLPIVSYSNILCLDTKGHVGINLTQGLAIAPTAPTANLHVNGTVRFENLPSSVGGGNYLIVDANGNLKVSASSIANRPIASSDSLSATDVEIESLKQEIINLKEKLLALEAAINGK